MCFSFLFPKKNPDGMKLTIDDIINIFKEYKAEGDYNAWLDSKYSTESLEMFLTLINENQVDKEKYISEYFDCDNFAIALFGYIRGNPDTAYLPFGLAFVNADVAPHAVNIFIASDLKVYMCEPQNDNVWEYDENDSEYVPYFIML